MTFNKILINQIKSAFKKSFFEDNPLLINAPGRINLIGEHTDYNHGFVLPGAIDKSIVFGMGMNSSKRIHIRSLENEQTTIDPGKEATSFHSNWGRYFQAMVEEIRLRKLNLEGVNCCFGGDIPIGSGLSSSAALCCGFLFGLNKMFDWDLPLLELAKIGQAAEHRTGARVGLMDQFAVLHGKKDKVIYLDCLDYSYQHFPLTLNEYSLILINSNVKHELADSAYNKRRESCERILAKLQQQDSGVKTLRDVTLQDLKSFENHTEDEEDIRRVAYVLRENERVKQTTEALSQQNLNRVGALLYESHEGLSKDYQVSCPELDLLVDLAKKEEVVLGARMMGGGFGGCTINLVLSSEADATVSRIKGKYEEMTMKKPESYLVSLEEGVNLLS